MLLGPCAIVAGISLIAFALFGALAPGLEHRLGLEKALVFGMARALVQDVWLFGIFSAVSLAGMGLGNVLPHL